jgi:hypothetical protein
MIALNFEAAPLDIKSDIWLNMILVAHSNEDVRNLAASNARRSGVFSLITKNNAAHSD